MSDPSWMDDADRRSWTLNSLRFRRNDLRERAVRCRKAYKQDHMREPANWLADAYDEAADVLDRRIGEVVSTVR